MAFNILVIDDSATIRSVIKRTLKMAQVPINNLFEAGNGQEGLDIINDNWIDLVFTDINMPVMDGIEFIRILNEKNLIKELPVVVISTEGSSTRIEELLEMGIKSYLHKPFSPEKLKAVVDELLGLG